MLRGQRHTAKKFIIELIFFVTTLSEVLNCKKFTVYLQISTPTVVLEIFISLTRLLTTLSLQPDGANLKFTLHVLKIAQNFLKVNKLYLCSYKQHVLINFSCKCAKM